MELNKEGRFNVKVLFETGRYSRKYYIIMFIFMSLLNPSSVIVNLEKSYTIGIHLNLCVDFQQRICEKDVNVIIIQVSITWEFWKFFLTAVSDKNYVFIKSVFIWSCAPKIRKFSRKDMSKGCKCYHNTSFSNWKMNSFILWCFK